MSEWNYNLNPPLGPLDLPGGRTILIREWSSMATMDKTSRVECRGLLCDERRPQHGANCPPGLIARPTGPITTSDGRRIWVDYWEPHCEIDDAVWVKFRGEIGDEIPFPGFAAGGREENPT